MANQNSERSSNLGVVDSFLVLLMAVASIGVFVVGLIPYATLLGDFPGTNLTHALVIAAVLGLLFGYIYSAIGTFFPHYGADYVLISRVLTGSLGFASSFAVLVG
ncbi:MAG: hypothetical protein N2035_10645, partial [Chthoniobacterales bacterium]|nr:hypothetical protein [Chthoniobacterales bacterium]